MEGILPNLSASSSAEIVAVTVEKVDSRQTLSTRQWLKSVKDRYFFAWHQTCKSVPQVT